MNNFILQFLMYKLAFIILLIIQCCTSPIFSQHLNRLNVVVELNIGETSNVTLINGEEVMLTLEDVILTRDPVRGAVRKADVKIKIDEKEVVIGSGNYNLPIQIGNIK